MKTKTFLFLIVVILLIGGTYRFSISQYEEECLEYKMDSWIELQCCDWTYGFDMCRKMYNETHKYYYDSISCDEYAFWYSKNITIYNTTDVCSKYHLVRKI